MLYERTDGQSMFCFLNLGGWMMHRKLKKITAVFLMAAMVMTQSGVHSLAEESAQISTEGLETAAEPQAQDMTEAQTQPPTEAVTETQTQPPTEAATEAQTQPPTEAVTEAQTQPPTEASTEPTTQAPTEPATEPPTSAGTQTEDATEKQTEKKKDEKNDKKKDKKKDKEKEKEKESETETETERSERVNKGAKPGASELASRLGQVLPYLFAAGEIQGPEKLLENQKLAQDPSLLEGLKSLSLELADAQSSDDLKIINLYADQSGKIDTAQLDRMFGDHVIDVGKGHYVVNVIADSKGQSLNFSGYSMKNSGGAVSYTKDTQSGDIIYNFAAMDGEGYTTYEGTISLSGSLQGTYLAPGASVVVQSDLAGAVYAKHVTVSDSVKKLLRIVFVKGNSVDPETEDSGSEVPESETEGQTTVGTDAEEIGTEAQTAAESGTEEPVTETQTATESGTEEPGTEAQTWGGLEIEEIETSAEAPDEITAAETETTNETAVSETETDEELIAVEEGIAAETLRWYSAGGAVLRVKLDDVSNGEGKNLAGSEVLSVKAAAPVKDEDGKTVLAKGEEAAAHTFTTEAAYDIGQELNYAGIYYLAIAGSEQYLGTSRIYFVVNEKGTAVLEGSAWDETNGLLTISLYREDAKVSGLKLTVTEEGSGQPVRDASFVLKNENGKVIRNKDGYPTWYLNYEGTPVVVSDLAEGTYYVSQIRSGEGYRAAADQKFVISHDALTELTVTNAKAADTGKTISVSARAYCQNTELTAETEQSRYVALFLEKERKTRVSDVKELVWKTGETKTDTVSFTGLEAGKTYYLAETDEFGEVTEPIGYQTQVTDESGSAVDKIAFQKQTTEENKSLTLGYQYSAASYPSGSFSYMAEIRMTLNVKNTEDQNEKTSETFYVQLYSDKNRKHPLLEDAAVFDMNGKASQKSTVKVKMTEASATYYIAEVDGDGKPVGKDFGYAVTYPGTEKGAFSVLCGAVSEVKIQNKRNNSSISIAVMDQESREYLAGAQLVIKDASGKVLEINNQKILESQAKAIKWQNLLEAGKTYYLSEVTAPEGYMPAPDLAFTVAYGQNTEVILANRRVTSTDYELSVNMQVYGGDHPLYAYDTTNGSFAAKGAYTFYAALFSDAERTQKVSNVQKITVVGLGGTVTFQNLTPNETYYVAETDEYGAVLDSGDNLTINYSEGGSAAMTEKRRTAVIQNVYANRPDGYRYTATLTITKNLLGMSGETKTANETFYVGIFRREDYSDTPTIVPLGLADTSTVSVRRRILLSGDEDMTYYIAEVDAQGNRVDDTFAYKVSIDQPALTITRGDDRQVTITNQVRDSKVTLYLTKKVYKGTAQQTVNETFYAGLFKDAAFTQAYTKPIALNLNGKSELTLKLSLNLGNASNATIYVAEVDANGNVIKNEQSFGYEIKVINSTAAFTEDRREIQSIILNSVYGTVTDDDWNTILHEDGNDSPNGGGGYITGNGIASPDAAGNVQTGDETPVALYIGLMAAALLVLAAILIWRMLRKRKKQ